MVPQRPVEHEEKGQEQPMLPCGVCTRGNSMLQSIMALLIDPLASPFNGSRLISLAAGWKQEPSAGAGVLIASAGPDDYDGGRSADGAEFQCRQLRLHQSHTGVPLGGQPGRIAAGRPRPHLHTAYSVPTTYVRSYDGRAAAANAIVIEQLWSSIFPAKGTGGMYAQSTSIATARKPRAPIMTLVQLFVKPCARYGGSIRCGLAGIRSGVSGRHLVKQTKLCAFICTASLQGLLAARKVGSAANAWLQQRRARLAGRDPSPMLRVEPARIGELTT
ncbi:hypothetical protein MMC07_007322 [Pseudocyphellaria aurata]|nr:hypothetical protein [Pseudocyphellaria aurata]